jgi:hypothetical protein
MKSITTSGSFRKADSSLDVTLNPVELPSKEIVSWGVAFPRPGSRTPRRAPMLAHGSNDRNRARDGRPHDGRAER